MSIDKLELFSGDLHINPDIIWNFQIFNQEKSNPVYEWQGDYMW